MGVSIKLLGRPTRMPRSLEINGGQSSSSWTKGPVVNVLSLAVSQQAAAGYLSWMCS